MGEEASGGEQLKASPPPATVQAVATVGKVEVSIRSYFSSQHLVSARHFAKLTQDREDALCANGPPSPFDTSHRAFAMAAVQSSVNFLEAAVNEVFQDAYDGEDAHVGVLDAGVRSQLSSVWLVTEAEGRGMSTLSKYRFALALANRPGLDEGSNPYQDAKLLVRARNELVHYKPKTLSASSDHELSERLRGRFPENALMAGSGNTWFPDHALGAGMAEWAARTAREFAEAFAAGMDMKLAYQNLSLDDPLDPC